MKKRKGPTRRRNAKRSSLFSLRVESGCAVFRARGRTLHIRVFDSAAAAIAAGLTKSDHIAYGRDSGPAVGEFIDPPAGKCETIDCCLEFTGSTGDDMEVSVRGKCKEPCTCTLYVQKTPDKQYEKAPNDRVKLMDYSGHASVCDK